MNIFVKYALSLWFVMPTFAKENFCPGISFRVADPDGFDPDPTLEEQDPGFIYREKLDLDPIPLNPDRKPKSM